VKTEKLPEVVHVPTLHTLALRTNLPRRAKTHDAERLSGTGDRKGQLNSRGRRSRFLAHVDHFGKPEACGEEEYKIVPFLAVQFAPKSALQFFNIDRFVLPPNLH
jgi:hypothetical protein